MKIVQEMRMGDHARQGDLLIIKIGEASPNKNYEQRDVIPDGIIALGEATGHAHRVATTLDEVFSPQDIAFLMEQQERLNNAAITPISEMKALEGYPIVMKPEHSAFFWGIFRGKSGDDKNVIARIHSLVPFWVVHYNKKTTGVIPVDSRKIIGAEKLHEPIQLPAGFYKVVQQREAAYTDSGTVKIRRVID